MENAKELGHRVAETRTQANVSQVALAHAMRTRGFAWSQATVWALERGDRKLLHLEAQALNEEIGLTLSPRTSEAVDAELQELRAFKRRIENAFKGGDGS